ncbi:hypothetical protein J3E69DRAFT_335318, partial [Trichoderma sp. SZMC 28015]
MLDTDLVTSPPSLCDRVDRDGFTSTSQPASARPLRPHSAAHIFAQLLVFIFSLSLTRTSYRAAGVARSPDLHLPAGGL